jgi:hypothetical protein
VGLVLVAAPVVSWLTAELLDHWLRVAVEDEYRPPDRAYPVSAARAAVGWVLAYAAVDARRPDPAHWYDLPLAWLRHLADVGLPSGWRAFGRGLVTAVPVSVAVALVVANALTAAVYEVFGSTARDTFFGPAFAAVTGLMLTRFLGRGRIRT